MSRYTINDGEIEIYLSFFPSLSLRNDMKSRRIWWDPDKKCWHAPYTSELENYAQRICEMPENCFTDFSSDKDEKTKRSVEEVLNDHKHICWYPSAGSDFREMLFLSEQYYNWNSRKDYVPIENPGPIPDLFILSDKYLVTKAYTNNYVYKNYKAHVYLEDYISKTRNNGVLLFCNGKYGGFETEIYVNSIERLKDVNKAESDNNSYSGRAYLFNVTVSSRYFMCHNTDLLYVFADNFAFAGNHLLDKHIESMILIRPGDGRNDKLKTIYFVKHIIGLVDCKYLISYRRYVEDRDFWCIDNNIKELEGYSLNEPKLEEYYKVDGKKWSYDEQVPFNNDVVWYRVKNVTDL